MPSGRGRPRPSRWSWSTLIEDISNSCQVDPETGCSIWQEGVDKNGYPKLFIENKHWRGNRAVLYVMTGELGSMALHSCHRPSCLNPDHLRWGTASDNVRDMWLVGRASNNLKSQSGSANGRSKLTDDQRRDVVSRRLAGERRLALAQEYGVAECTIAAITRAASAGIPTGRPRGQH